MSSPTRGRPARPELDKVILDRTLALLEQVGYDGLRVKDVAAAAGVGLGAIYRRWPGKHELVLSALRAAVNHGDPAARNADPRQELVDGLLRIAAAMSEGLGQLIAECLRHPGTEFAQIAITAKFAPMTAALAGLLEAVDHGRVDAAARAEAGIGLLLWHPLLTGDPVDEDFVRLRVLPAMGIEPTERTSP